MMNQRKSREVDNRMRPVVPKRASVERECQYPKNMKLPKQAGIIIIHETKEKSHPSNLLLNIARRVSWGFLL